MAVGIDRTKIEEQLRAAFEVVRGALSDEQRSSWQLKDKDKKAGVEVLTRPAGKIPQYLATGIVRGLVPEDVTRRVLEGGERREVWNALHDSTTQLDEWDSTVDGAHIRVFHERHKNAVGGIISPRDFVKASMRMVVGDAAWFVYTTVDAGIAPLPNFTRATAFPSGTRATTAPGSDAQHPASLLLTLVHADPAGSLPSWVIPKGVVNELTGFFIGVNKAFAQQ